MQKIITIFSVVLERTNSTKIQRGQKSFKACPYFASAYLTVLLRTSCVGYTLIPRNVILTSTINKGRHLEKWIILSRFWTVQCLLFFIINMSLVKTVGLIINNKIISYLLFITLRTSRNAKKRQRSYNFYI